MKKEAFGRGEVATSGGEEATEAAEKRMRQKDGSSKVSRQVRG